MQAVSADPVSETSLMLTVHAGDEKGLQTMQEGQAS